jgi:hypothetical protein
MTMRSTSAMWAASPIPTAELILSTQPELTLETTKIAAAEIEMRDAYPEFAASSPR